MRLYHVTPAENVQSILRRGILVSMARTMLRGVWLCARSQVESKILHVKARHQCVRVAVLMVTVRDRNLRRRGPGVWLSMADVPPRRILGQLVGGGAVV